MKPKFKFGRAKNPKAIDFKALRKFAKADPLGLINDCRERTQEVNSGTRERKWQIQVVLYAGALTIRDDEHQFANLLKHKYFEKRTYEAKIEDTLRLVFLIGNRAGVRGNAYNNATHYARALQRFFDKRTDPTSVMAAIKKAGGIKKVSPVLTFPSVAKKGKEGAALQLLSAPVKSPEVVTEKNAEPKAAGADPKPKTAGHDEVATDVAVVEEAMVTLEVECTKTFLDRVLAVADGGRARIDVEAVDGEAGWKRVIATRVKVLP